MDYKTTYAQIQDLFKKGDYQNALQLTLLLRQEYQSDPYLHRMINKIKKVIREGELHGRGGFIKKGIKSIRQLRRSKEYEKVIQACGEVLSVDPDNKTVHKLRQKAQIALIEKKLKDPTLEEWRAQNDYGNLYVFYHKLKKVFPHYIKLNKLIFETEKKMLQEDRIKKKTFAEDSLKKLRQWYSEGRYEAVIEGAEDLVMFTHEGSVEAKKLLKIATKVNRKEIERDTIEYIKNQLPILKAAFENKTEEMIKI